MEDTGFEHFCRWVNGPWLFHFLGKFCKQLCCCIKMEIWFFFLKNTEHQDLEQTGRKKISLNSLNTMICMSDSIHIYIYIFKSIGWKAFKIYYFSSYFFTSYLIKRLTYYPKFWQRGWYHINTHNSYTPFDDKKVSIFLQKWGNA